MQKDHIKDVIKPLYTKSSLSAETEHLVKNEGMGYAEAIIHICSQSEIDPEDIAKLIGAGPLKEKIKVEAQSYNMLPKSNTMSLY